MSLLVHLQVRFRAACIAFLAIYPGLVSGCSLNGLRGTFPESRVLPPAETGRLQNFAAAVETGLDAGESALWLLDKADFALDARLAMVDEATQSLDIQYFIWEKDPSSRLFAHRIALAAERGVRVRILLDDLTLNGQDREYFGLDMHPNIEIRTFNPWNRRSKAGRFAEFAIRFGRLNNRMHNKIMVADGQVGMVGGRNIGDRYFGLWDAFVQNDLDVLLTGPVVFDLRSSFDRYWNSTEAYPICAVIGRRTERQSFSDTFAFVSEFVTEHADLLNKFPLQPIDWGNFLERLESSVIAAPVEYVTDNPEISRVRPEALIAPLIELLNSAEQRVVISSPYLVPDEDFIETVGELVGRGVEVVILTNSMYSNNHKIAHTAYEQARRRLLRLGVELYESRPDSSAIDYYTTSPATPGFLGLHTKAAVVDGQRLYLGSANIDPRSLELNTELGLFVESAELAAGVLALIERDMQPEAAWKVELQGRRRLSWTAQDGTVYRQPAKGFAQRIAKFFISLLPIKQQS